MDVLPVGVWSCFLNLFLFGIKVVGGVLGGDGGGFFVMWRCLVVFLGGVVRSSVLLALTAASVL